MFPNDSHLLLQPFSLGKHQGSCPKGASEDQPAGAVKSSSFLPQRVSWGYGAHILMIFET